MFTTVVAAHDDTMPRLLWPEFWADSGFELTGVATDSSWALELVTAERPDVVLIDPAIPPLGGLLLVAALAVAAPDTQSFLLPGPCRRATIDRAIALGASGCFLDGHRLRLAPPRAH
jgi:DNA-binding NarL/FixJ family response regulator